MLAKEPELQDYQKDIFLYMLKSGLEYLAAVSHQEKQLDGIIFVGIQDIDQGSSLRRLFPRSCCEGGYPVRIRRFGLLTQNKDTDNNTPFLAEFSRDKGIIQVRNTGYYLESCLYCGATVYWEDNLKSNVRINVTDSAQDYKLRQRESKILVAKVCNSIEMRSSSGGFDW